MKTVEERFWEKVDQTGGTDACWPWLVGKDKYGSGTFHFNGKPTPARRVAYELEFGQIPEGLQIRADQTCEPACVNPAHLSALTKSESGRRNRQRQLEERFWEKVDQTGGADGCWPWRASKNKSGSGIFNSNGKPTQARRVAYELEFGQIPEGLQIRAGQTCEFTCVNPAHLSALTKSENGRRSGQHQLNECKNGHPFTLENTHYRSGKRNCTTCRIDWLEAEISRLSQGSAIECEDSRDDREPVHPDLWGNRPRVIGGRVVDEKFERRFWKKVDCKGGPEACWTWIKGKDPTGYGIFYISNSKNSKKRTQAHIVAYQLEVGPIPEGLVIDHFRCANKPCCNPAHLEPVTNEENTRRARRTKPYCGRGHPHNEENSYFTRNGIRHCRACRYTEVVGRLQRLREGFGPRQKLTSEERFWAKVGISDDPNACWPWLGKTKKAAGYGSCYYGGRSVSAHRLAWELANGRPIPEGLTIDHKCRNKSCCNPDHLEPVSVEENSRRAAPFKPSHGQPTEDRFWAQADTSGGPNACWNWPGESILFWDSEHRRTVNVRHFIYGLKVGSVPQGKWIRSICGNPACVNYQHLRLTKETVAQQKGRPASGSEQLALF